MIADLGKKIRSLRKAFGLTLVELSDSSGLSTSFISQIERGLTSISLDSLERIADSLGVSVDYLFHDAKDYTGPLGASAPYICPSCEPYYYKVLSNDAGGKSIRVIQATILPFSNKPYSKKKTGFIFILSGILTIEWNGEKAQLFHGDCLYMDGTIEYKFTNNSEGLINYLYVSYTE